MKRFLTCALCFVSLPAIAVTLYYEQGGMCSGLYRSPGCNGTRVTHLSVTPDADTTFTGFKVNDQTIVYANGNVVSNASEILRNAGNIGSKIPQSYDCKSGFSKNNNGICVDFSGNTQYVEGDSGETTPPQAIGIAAPGCFWVYDFDIVFHDRPMQNPPHAVGTFEPELEPGPNNPVTIKHKRGNGFYSTSGTGVESIKIPRDNNYMFRGYYGKTFNYLNYNTNGGWPIPITDVITDHTTAQGTVWGARFAVPADATDMNLGTPNLKTSYCDMNWIACNNQGRPDCGEPELPDPVIVDVYGGWARKCSGDHGDCGIQIYTTPSGAYTAGDVKYNNTCDPGYTLVGNGNTYEVQCEQLYNKIQCSFNKYKVYKGSSLVDVTESCLPQVSDMECYVNANLTLPNYGSFKCGGNTYNFAKWQTNDQVLHNGGDLVSCTPQVLGGQTANITGILCDCDYAYTERSSCYSVCPTSGGDTCTFGGRCTITACTNMGGVCTNSSGTECTCNQPSSDEPEWVAVEFRYGNVTLTSPASPTTFYLDKKRKCYYAYTQPAPKDNCGSNSPYRLKNITIPTAQGKTFAGFWRESQSLRIIDADGNVRATNQGIEQLTFNSSATATVMYLTAHWN